MKLTNSESVSTPRCILCRHENCQRLAKLDKQYYCCEHCALIFVEPSDRLSAEEEQARYETHQNDPADLEYREFLSQLCDPLLDRLDLGASGLDFGSGPGPTLSQMMVEQGYSMEIYDPFFSADRSVLERKYDFITCSETAEHFFFPEEEFELFSRLLRPRGYLGIMTLFLQDEDDFANWWYRRDPTHVCFYQPKTIRWIAERWNLQIDHLTERVAIFKA